MAMPETELPVTPFGDLRNAEQTVVFYIIPKTGLTEERDMWHATGTADVAFDTDHNEFTLNTGQEPGSTAALRSVRRGVYRPGSVGEAGIGIRLPEPPGKDQEARWGYFNDTQDGEEQEGLYFGVEKDGMYVAVMRNGDETRIPASDWNGNISAEDIDLSQGYVFEISYTWYGYGPIAFQVVTEQGRKTIHRYKPRGTTSITNPNLPVRADIRNGDTGEAFTLRVAGRKYALYGQFNPDNRTGGEQVSLPKVSNTFTNVVTLRKRGGYETIPVSLARLAVGVDKPVVVELRADIDTADTPTWRLPERTPEHETAVEVSTDATPVMDTGRYITSMLIGAEQRSATSVTERELQHALQEYGPVTVAARTTSPQSAKLNAIIEWEEEW